METLSLNGIKAIIFDMDGTMVDNMDYHDLSWKLFANKHGVNLSVEERKKQAGRNIRAIMEMIFGKDLSKKIDSSEKEAIYRDLYRGHIEEVPGLKKIMGEFKKRGLRTAVATGAPINNRELVLKELKMMDIFDAIVGDEDIILGKPNPDIYLEAAKRLGVKPEECLVFEDTVVGIEAGLSAGMRVVGIGTSHGEDVLTKAEAVVKDYLEIVLSE